MSKNWTIGLLVLVFLTACTAAVPPTQEATDVPAPTVPPPSPTMPPRETLSPSPTPAEGEPTEPVIPDRPQTFGSNEFTTDFSKATIPFSEINTLLQRDSIPAINNPDFIPIEEADAWLGEFEPVVFLKIGDDARAYPLQILMWHEIVNDLVDGVPVVVTFCPLCNTAIAFERFFEDQILDFGTTGRLRFSNLIMYDRQTNTWWQQADGQAIVGEHAGKSLNFLPAAIIGWTDFKEAHADGLVLSRNTGFSRDYGLNPYAGYDDVRRSPFAYDGPETPGELLAMARVLTVELNEEAVAYPYDILSEVQVVNDEVGGEPVVVFWTPGTNSALDQSAIAIGRDVGAANSFSPLVDDEILTFRPEGDLILDDQTDSVWSVLGTALDGPLAGSQLEPVVGVNHFWFSWAAFKPETRVYQ